MKRFRGQTQAGPAVIPSHGAVCAIWATSLYTGGGGNTAPNPLTIALFETCNSGRVHLLVRYNSPLFTHCDPEPDPNLPARDARDHKAQFPPHIKWSFSFFSPHHPTALDALDTGLTFSCIVPWSSRATKNCIFARFHGSRFVPCACCRLSARSFFRHQ